MGHGPRGIVHGQWEATYKQLQAAAKRIATRNGIQDFSHADVQFKPRRHAWLVVIHGSGKTVSDWVRR